MSLNVNGPGTVVLTSGGNTYNGPTTISAGLLQLGNGGTTGSVGSTSSIVNNGVLAFNRSDNVFFAPAISGSGSLLQFGPGAVTLSGVNTYTGGTTVSGGTVSITNSSALGSGGLSIWWPGVVDLNAQSCVFPSLFGSTDGVLTDLSTTATGMTTVTVSSTPSGFSNYGGTICDGGSRTLSLVLSGSGALTLSGINSYTGGTTVTGGMLEVTTTASLPGYDAGGKVFVASGATLAVNAGGTGEWNSTATDDIGVLLCHATFNSGSALGIDTTDAAGAVTYSGSIGGNLAVVKLGSNTLILSGTNTYVGGTTLSGGTLSITNSSALGGGGLSIGPQGVFDLDAQNYVLPSLSGSAGGVLTDLSTTATGMTTVTVSSAPSGSSNYGGTICDGSSRTLSLVVSGSEALTLSGTNTYTGGTTVTGGTLEFAGTAALSSTGILTIQSGGEVVFGDLLGAATPSTADSEPAAADVAADSTSSSSSINGISTLLARIRAAQVAHEDVTASAGSVTASASPAAVPEPSTFALLGVAVIGLLGYVRSRKRIGA